MKKYIGLSLLGAALVAPMVNASSVEFYNDSGHDMTVDLYYYAPNSGKLGGYVGSLDVPAEKYNHFYYNTDNIDVPLGTYLVVGNVDIADTEYPGAYIDNPFNGDYLPVCDAHPQTLNVSSDDYHVHGLVKLKYEYDGNNRHTFDCSYAGTTWMHDESAK